jgi:hypothetical protein
MPAKAGIQYSVTQIVELMRYANTNCGEYWIPAFAGMTTERFVSDRSQSHTRCIRTSTGGPLRMVWYTTQ